MVKHWSPFCKQKGLSSLDVCVSDLVEYLDLLQVNHDYFYRKLSMYVSVICSILWPTEQTRSSSASSVWQFLKGVFMRNQPDRVWAETWNIKKVNDLLQS